MSTDEHLFDDGERFALRPRRRASARDTVRGAVAAFVVAGLLGSGALVDLAERQPFGWPRDVLVGAAGSLDRVANALSLNRPADAAADLLGRGGPEADVEAILEERRAEPPPEAPEEVELRAVTAAAPLTMYVGGDSMVRELGAAMKEVVADRPVVSTTDFKVISGLTRDDYYDWPARLAEVVAGDRPEAIVLMFGSNDFQGIRTDGGEVFEEGSAGWREEYRRRVADVMDLLEHPGTTVHWVGLPVMRSDEFSEHARLMNDIYRAQAADRPWVTYVSTYEAFADAGGHYAAYLEVDGALQAMRQEDGVHWSSPGARRAASTVFAAVAETWAIPSP